ncbi:hypothetical protein D9758_008100 [Tetrapyrgos nigripes]|uniref:ATP-dependent DNA helicase n=1 Tax=Tetrapyrgos nigripes TaxID=182062 RepID=A0A8H5GHF1_9AGAR|nr:hypothetical protein D9758_008100 [Tetrapyrgos nigripes]
MKANIMCFSNPVEKIYNILPPGKDELDEMIAFMFTGPSKPTPEQLRNTPLLVRRAVVKSALEWLKLNHKDYQDILISETNLNSYDEESVPLSYEFHEQQFNKDALTTAINEEVDDEGTETGPCPVSVHGLTGEEFGGMTSHEMRAAALKHLRENKKNILFVAHDEQPVSTFHNPSLFPMMYPHLFPYGLGGINNSMQTSKMGQTAHKAFYLMYYDKHFQMEPSFPIVAFNIEQLKQGNDRGFIITHRKNISSIAERIRNVNGPTLDMMYNRFKNKERVVPTNTQEKACLQLINDVDATACRVQGSVTSKKHMRNETPMKSSSRTYRTKKIRESLIKQNPVAAARFFDFMVKAFIKHVLGVDADHEVDDVSGKDQNIPDEKVWMNKSGNNTYIGVSKVDDYTLQGEEITDLNLYDFMTSYYKKSIRKRRTREKVMNEADPEMDDGAIDEGENRQVLETETHMSDVNGLPSVAKLHTDHPQHETHALLKYKHLESRALNFIGRTLPQSDKGDHEYYCCVMLSLFKPWRVGSELREVGETWGQAFRWHVFSEEQKQLMKNFNLRYECSGPGFDVDELEDDAMHEFLQNINNSFGEDTMESNLDFNTEEFPNNSSIRNNLLNEQISKTLDTSGMMDSHSDKYEVDKEANAFHPDPTIDGSTWRQRIANKKNSAILSMKHSSPFGRTDLTNKNNHKFSRWNEVIFDDVSYIDRHFKSQLAQEQKISDDIVEDENLNEEQQRAFKIIANHAMSSDVRPLKMYMGGMGGTGKSRVIQALRRLFDDRGEGHAMVVCAPTGTAAALVHGTTYHSLLGFSRPSSEEVTVNEDSGIKRARDNLEGVRYIFIDEVSMLSMQDMARINQRLAQISGNQESGFGGYSIIFAGDFAQLPPVGGTALYTKKMPRMDRAHSLYTQVEEMGKALWHQVTHVVILRKNMRQQTLTASDAQLRTALENLRLASCTTDDIAYLQSRVAGWMSDCPKINSSKFRYVSIITSRNTQRDQINKQQLHRFAEEVNEPLHSFYSWDIIGQGKDPAHTRRKKYRATAPPNIMSDSLRQALWELPPCDTGHLPGILQFCKGMPVMIKYNEATELCITNGQEAHVHGWKSAFDTSGKEYLDVLQNAQW